VGHTYLELFGPNPTFDIWLAHFSQVSFSGEAAHFEQFAETTGLHFDVLAYYPRPGQCAVIMTDITERRRTEDSLKKSQHLLQLFVEHSPAAIAMFDREMRYITVSRRFLQDYGLGEQDLTGRSHYEVFPEISETIKEIHRRCLLGAIEKSDADPFPRAAGRQDWVRWEVRPWYEEEGTIGGIILFSEVITESKHAEQALYESERLYRLISEHSADVIWVFNLTTQRFTYVSPSIYKLSGKTPQELMSEPMEKVITPDSYQAIYEGLPSRIHAFIAGDETARVSFAEVDQYHKDGSIIPIEVVTTLVADKTGQVTEIIGVSRDISKRKQAEQRFGRAFNASPSAQIISRREDGRILEVNDSFVQLFGYNREEVIGKTSSELNLITEPVDREKAVRQTHENSFLRDFELDIRTKGGEVHTVILSMEMLTDQKDDLMLTVIQDVTEFKLAEKETRSARAFLEKVIDMSPLSMWISDTKGTLIRVNRSLCEALNLTEDQIIGKYNVLADENLEAEGVMPEVKAVFKEYRPARFTIPWKAAKAGRVDFKGGRNVYIDVSMFPILNEQGGLSHVVCQWIDITERKLAEEKLRESEKRFSTIFHSSPIGVTLTLLADGRIENVNDEFLRMVDYTREEVVGRTTLELNLWPDFEGQRQATDILLAQKRVHGLEQKFCRKSGTIGYALVSAEMIDLDNQQYLLVMYSDITEQKQAEEERERLQRQLLQAQKMESIGQLAGGVAHDFNNLLGVIIGQAEMALAKIPVSDPSSKHLEEILDAAQRSAALTSQLLAFARKQTINPRLLDMNETISASLKMLRRLIGEDFDLVWQPGTGAQMVRMDPIQVEQILTNLLVNARDAINGVGKVVIETKQVKFDEEYCARHVEATPGDYTLLAVSDNGRGMDQQTVAHIFEPFFTTKEVGVGTGMGLATVFGIVKQNNGLIYVYSEPGEGSTFTIYLPRAEGAVVSSILPEKIASTLGGSETILIVEDESALLQLCRDMLEDLGYRVLAAGTPGEAMKLARENAGNLHLLITDVVMPEMNGRMLANEIISISPGIKVLFTSGYTANVIVHRGVLDEGVVFLQKPYHHKDLAARVREALAQP